MNRCVITVGVLVVFILAGRLVSAQQSPKPGPEHERLKEFVGNWDALIKTNGPTGAKESKGTAVYKMECGGLWLITEFNGEFGDEKFQGRGIDGFDTDKQKYVAVWIDSMTTAPMTSEGTYDAKTKTLTYSAVVKGPDGKPTKVKSVTTWKDKDHHSFQMFMIGEDSKETSIMTIDYTRKK